MENFSFAQNGEDILLWRCFGDQQQGFYVDVGASSPIVDSVTHLFYERGWSGLNLEPIPERAAELRRARPRDITICAAAGDRNTTVCLARTAGVGGLSSVVSPLGCSGEDWIIETKQVRLSDVLADYGIISV